MKIKCELSESVLICSELQVKHYKNLIKSLYGEEPDPEVFFDVLYEIIEAVTNKPRSAIEQMSILDLFCLMIEIRRLCHGDLCKLSVQTEDKKVTLSLNLALLKMDLLKLSRSLAKVVAQDDIQISCRCPSFKRLENVKEDAFAAIASVNIREQQKMQITDNEQAEQLLDRLSSKTFFEINQVVNEILASVRNFNIFGRYSYIKRELNFSLSKTYFVWFSKLMFGEDLNEIFNNIFYLSHYNHMNAQYIEELPVGEYNVYVSLLKGYLQSQSSSSENPPPTLSDSSLDYTT